MSEHKKETAFFSIRNLTVEYHSGNSVIYAVNDVSFDLKEGETLGLVGETGAGKTTIAKSVLRILPEHSVERIEGEIFYNGRDILKMTDTELHSLRGSQISMIFQDPMTALNPVKTVLSQIAEGYRQQHGCTKSEANKRAVEMLELVGIGADRAGEYPHQFSGGMKQRVVIALALSCSPKLLLADEPTGNLDQRNAEDIMRLLEKINRQGTTVLVVSHNQELVKYMHRRQIALRYGKVIKDSSRGGLMYGC